MTFLKPYIVTENKYLPDMIKTVMWNLSFHTLYKQEERKVIGFFFLRMIENVHMWKYTFHVWKMSLAFVTFIRISVRKLLKLLTPTD